MRLGDRYSSSFVTGRSKAGSPSEVKGGRFWPVIFGSNSTGPRISYVSIYNRGQITYVYYQFHSKSVLRSADALDDT